VFRVDAKTHADDARNELDSAEEAIAGGDPPAAMKALIDASFYMGRFDAAIFVLGQSNKPVRQLNRTLDALYRRLDQAEAKYHATFD
jgi:hypothetical protein